MSPFDSYTNGLVALAVEAHKTIRYERELVVDIEERRMTLPRRQPDDERLQWAEADVA